MGKRHEEEALELWREYFLKGIDPLGEDVVGYCFFCLAEVYSGWGDDKHEPDCIYVRAKKLVEGIEDER
jgi:hypothetical protein